MKSLQYVIARKRRPVWFLLTSSTNVELPCICTRFDKARVASDVACSLPMEVKLAANQENFPTRRFVKTDYGGSRKLKCRTSSSEEDSPRSRTIPYSKLSLQLTIWNSKICLWTTPGGTVGRGPWRPQLEQLLASEMLKTLVPRLARHRLSKLPL